MTLEELLNEIKLLSAPGKGFKPHKYIALMTVQQLIREGKLNSPAIPFDSAFKQCFGEIFNKYGGEGDRNRPYTPFFHLRNTTFWRLIPNTDQESALAKADSVGGSAELEKLVSYAVINDDVYRLMSSESSATLLENTLVNCIKKGIISRGQNAISINPQKSLPLFPHEIINIDRIGTGIETHNLGYGLSNFEIYDKQTNSYFETDLIIICTFGAYVIELKHWSGKIDIRPNSWIQNESFFKPDPHKINNFKAKMLKGIYERQFTHYPDIYFESVVVLTNPEAEVIGASNPTTIMHNPTIAGTKQLIDYLIKQLNSKEKKLDLAQCKTVRDFLEKQRAVAVPRNFLFPGYEIVQNLFQNLERAEFIARRTDDIRNRKLSRLRIFFPPTNVDDIERRRFLEKAKATLNAVARTGDHPNILKVWDIPNENNYIVEGSDWSEVGTLQDVISQDKHLPEERAIKIFEGILNGLKAIHEKYIIHRFLSPENILLIGDMPKLMNFDLSYQLEEDRVTVITDGSKLKPSPYVAPEIYKTGTTPEAMADLFSAGVILYEMLTGAPPIKSSTDLMQSKGCLDDQHNDKLLKHTKNENLIKLIFSLVYLDPNKRAPSAEKALEMLHGTAAPSESPVVINEVLQPGIILGVYEVEQFITLGVESQLYLASGPHARKVTLKLFNLDVPLKRILNERDFTSDIRHPCLIKYDNYSRHDDGRLYIAFDWVAGNSMREEIEAKKRPDLKRFAGIAQQLLEALQSLHNLTGTVLHNDIKPDNIILSDGDHPVLIDFGLASTPYTGTYEGSDGYVAPDLRSGQDREYSVSGDIYSMGVTLYEWLTGSLPPPYQDTDEEAASTSAFPEGLKTWIRTAVATDTDLRFTSAHDMASELQKGLSAPSAPEPAPKYEESLKPAAAAERSFVPSLDVLSPNPFVAYLNSLHCRDAGNEKALAEAQVTDPNFSYIQVPQPITQNVIDALTGKDKLHIILTGHAGDGKSTIAAEVYKSLMSIPLGEPLHEGLHQHEELNYKGKKIVIVKDFSELPDRIGLIKETLDTSATRFFLVSNTGTLLDAFRRYEKSMGGDVLQVENDILSHIEINKPKTLNYHGSEFKIINMSLINNLDLAEQIFRHMIAKERWEPCTKQECRKTCPIFRNVSLIQANEEIVRERIFLAYQRMNEYGQRLTLRQLCGHMAYMITAGLNYQDIQSMAQKAGPPPHSNFMFFNRFFGDDGWNEDIPAGQISAVRAVREQGFGNHLCSSWERRLWMRSKALEFDFTVQGCQNEFTDLRENGNRQNVAAYTTPSAARNQVRRILYFLYPFSGEPEGTFLKTFLNSAMILDFSLWQRQSGNHLSHLRGNLLRQKILHVLHEHFTGIRLPEGTANEGYLYITLSRRASDVRQSAQIVLTSVPATAFKLLLETVTDATGSNRKELMMTCLHNGTNLRLLLGLPFLDYVMMRDQGEIGQDLQASYVDRLERFKAQITKASADRDSDNVMLVRLRTNYTFKSHVYAVHNGKLEVTDG